MWPVFLPFKPTDLGRSTLNFCTLCPDLLIYLLHVCKWEGHLISFWSASVWPDYWHIPNTDSLFSSFKIIAINPMPNNIAYIYCKISHMADACKLFTIYSSLNCSKTWLQIANCFVVRRSCFFLVPSFFFSQDMQEGSNSEVKSWPY